MALPESWTCPNCDFSASRQYCAFCGQSRAEWNLSLVAWVRRASSEILDLDGRFFRTMTALLTSPGELTRAWIDGKRTSYVTPLRLYLLTSAVLFGVLALPGISFDAATDAVAGGLDGYIKGAFLRYGNPPPSWLLAASQDEVELARMARRIVDHLPRAMFVLLPLAAGLLRAALRGTHSNYVVHLVWTLHFHTLLFLALAFMIPLSALSGVAKYAIAYPAVGLLALWVLWHGLRAFSLVYRQSLPKSILLLGVISLVYVSALTGAAVLVSGLLFPK